MSSKFDKYDLAACVLLEALYTTDEIASKKYGISERTLRNYRQRHATDPKLADLFRQKKQALDAQWAETLPKAMQEAAQTIADIAQAVRTDPMMKRNPVMLQSLAGALKLCADVYYTGKVIDARIARENSPERPLLGPGVTETDSQYPEH